MYSYIVFTNLSLLCFEDVKYFLGQFYVFEGIDLLKNIHMYRQQAIN